MEEALKQQPSSCIKVVLYGPESTGKTTLARELATHYNTLWVPEYMREYLQKKWDTKKEKCKKEDLLPIAVGQMKAENAAAVKTDTILFCDTNLLELKVYSEYYYNGYCPKLIEKYAKENSYNLYLLTDIDVPFIFDDLRDRPDDREKLFRNFEAQLKKYDHLNFQILKGSKEERLSTAIKTIKKFIEANRMLTKKDEQQIVEYGLSKERVVDQLNTFAHGTSFVDVVTSASVGNGIEVIPKSEKQKLVDYYEEKKEDLDIVRFIPASGAATRMFKFLHNFLESYDPKKESLNAYLKKGNYPALTRFLNSLKDFAFVSQVRKKIRENFPDYKHSTKGMRSYVFVKTMLEEEGLNFSNLPKGLIPFHKYSKYATTAFEEQLYETAFYASARDEAYLHFTFSEDHLPYFKEEFEGVKKRVSKKTKTSFNITYSFQSKITDTIAVTPENKPFRNKDGKIVFRPSGHGALIQNLNDIDADIIFIKNIDNVVTEEYVEETAFYKKLLAGKLLWLQNRIFNYLRILSDGNVSDDLMKEIKSFLWNELNIKETRYDSVAFYSLLNRPLRVCGMVRNTGAPGGGPFWVKKNDITTLQIVEMVQIDTLNPHQKAIVNEATHFNPVDIVCGVRDYKGNKFNLLKYVDMEQGLISSKSVNGRPLKALERPGLWNGSMAKWNTACIEVPIETFNPVKTVNDLLNKEHRPNL